MKIQMYFYLFEMWEFRQKEKKYGIFDFLFEFLRQNCKQKFYFFGPLQIISLLKKILWIFAPKMFPPFPKYVIIIFFIFALKK